ncbi:MAG: thioredoxin domain-containing protein [Myxococcota bacterium]|jgi:protein-disulfide isomerase|nr:thioredoxin domain-containing protein [Myxococcota bacterium]
MHRRSLSLGFSLTALALWAAALPSACRDPEESGSIAPSLDSAPSFKGTKVDFEAGARCPQGSASPLNNAYSPFIGGDEALDIVIAVSSDLQCPYCANFAAMLDDMWQRRPDLLARVRLYFHHFPIESLHPNSTELHLMAAAVTRQSMDHFWSFHDRLFAWHNDGIAYSIDDALRYLDSIGVDRTQLETDLADEQNTAYVKWDLDQAVAAGVEGTPWVFVCGQPLANRYYLENVLDNLLE